MLREIREFRAQSYSDANQNLTSKLLKLSSTLGLCIIINMNDLCKGSHHKMVLKIFGKFIYQETEHDLFKNQ